MVIRDGQRLIDRLIREGMVVTAAAWVKESDSGDWYLYLVTPLVGKAGDKRRAYSRVNEVIRELQPDDFWMEPFAKKVIGPHEPIAKEILRHWGSRPFRTPMWFRGPKLGDLAVEEALIYPPPAAAKATREDKKTKRQGEEE